MENLYYAAAIRKQAHEANARIERVAMYRRLLAEYTQRLGAIRSELLNPRIRKVTARQQAAAALESEIREISAFLATA